MTRRSTRPWSRSHDRRSPRGAGRDGHRSRRRRRRRRRDARRPAADRADRGRPRGPPVRRREAADAARDRRARRHGPRDGRRPARRPGGLAARPRHPAPDRWRPGRARDSGRRRRARRSLCRRRRRPPLAGVARDARDRRLPPARDEGRGRAHPRRRLGLHDADPAASPVHRRARPVRGARPAVPVRHRLRIPRALRADQPRRDAAARRRRRRASCRGGWRTDHRTALPARRHGQRRRRHAPSTRTDGHRAPPEGPRRGGRRLAPGQRGADRQRPGHGRRQAGQARDAGRPREGDHRRRRQGHRCRLGARVPDAPQAGRRHLHRPRPPRLQDRARHDPDGDAPRGRPPLPGRPPRPGFRGPARADQRRGVGGSGAPSAPRHRARIRDRPAGAAQPGSGQGHQGRHPARRGSRHADRSARHDRDRDPTPDRADLAAARQPDLVSRDPGPGLEAPVAPDVRGRRRPDRPPGPRPDGSGSPRRAAERSRAPASGAGGPRPGRRGRCQQGRGEDGDGPTPRRRASRGRERAAAAPRGGAAVAAERGLQGGLDDDRLHGLAGARARPPLRRLRRAVALVGRRPGGVLVVGRRLLRHPAQRRVDRGPRRRDDARRALVRRGAAQLRGGASPACRAGSARAPVRLGTEPAAGGLGGGAPGRRGGGGRGVAPARRRAWRSRRRDDPEHPRGGRRIAGVREPRGDLVELLAGLRRARSHRSLRADLAQGADRRRRLHLRRQAVRSPRGRRRAPRGAADPRADGRDPVSGP